MKTTIMGIVVLALAVLVGMPSVASAQLTGPPIDIDVPFEFWVGDTKLAKGKYQITRLVEDSPQVNEMVIASAAGHVRVAFLTNSAVAKAEPKQSEAHFKNYNGKRYLHTIFSAGNRDGVEVQPGRSEKKAAKSGAKPKVEKHPAAK